MHRNRLAQRQTAGRHTVIQLTNRRLSRVPQQNPPPHLKWKIVYVAASAISKIVAHRNRAPAGKVHTRADSIDCRSVPREVQFHRTLRFFRPANATNAAAPTRRRSTPPIHKPPSRPAPSQIPPQPVARKRATPQSAKFPARPPTRASQVASHQPEKFPQELPAAIRGTPAGTAARPVSKVVSPIA